MTSKANTVAVTPRLLHCPSKYMASCENQLTAFVRRIAPTASQKDGASRSHNFLRESLNSGNMTNRVVDSYLSGSYARDTAIRPLDDVDIIVLIDRRHWAVPLFATYPDPDAVLRTFSGAIRHRYQDSSLRTQNRSIRLRLFHLNIDVVPAMDSGKGDGLILIPDRREGDWILTAPKMHTEIASAINQQQSGRFKPLVKFLKFWNTNLPSTAQFKSFAVETIACRIFSKIEFSSIQHGLLLFFDFIAFLGDETQAFKWNDNYGVSFEWGTKVPDLANTGSNVTAGVESYQKQRFIECAVSSRNRMMEAENARSEEVAWKKVAQALRC